MRKVQRDQMIVWKGITQHKILFNKKYFETLEQNIEEEIEEEIKDTEIIDRLFTKEQIFKMIKRIRDNIPASMNNRNKGFLISFLLSNKEQFKTKVPDLLEIINDYRKGLINTNNTRSPPRSPSRNNKTNEKI